MEISAILKFPHSRCQCAVHAPVLSLSSRCRNRFVLHRFGQQRQLPITAPDSTAIHPPVSLKAEAVYVAGMLLVRKPPGSATVSVNAPLFDALQRFCSSTHPSSSAADAAASIWPATTDRSPHRGTPDRPCSSGCAQSVPVHHSLVFFSSQMSPVRYFRVH